LFEIAAYLTSKFVTIGHISDRKTRNSQQLNISSCKTAAGQRTFQYRIVDLWNLLDKDLKLCKGSMNLKKNLKAKMLDEFLKQE